MDATSDFCRTAAITSGYQSEDDSGAAPDISLQTELPKDVITWGDVTDLLLDIAQLNNDWDGQGGIAPGTLVVSRCFELAHTLRQSRKFAPPTKLRPTPDGCVSFEWVLEGGTIEAEISATNVDWFSDLPHLSI